MSILGWRAAWGAIATAISCGAWAGLTINIDFNPTDGVSATYSGMAAAADGGTVWNGLPIGPEAGAPLIGAYTSPALVASTGVQTPVTLSLGNFKVYEADERSPVLTPALMRDFAYQQILGTDGPHSTFTIDKLDPTVSYDLYLLSQNGGYASAATLFTINGISRTAVNVSDGGAFAENTNYVLFQQVAPDATGRIKGSFNSAKAQDNAAFNGLQIVQREPAPPPPPPAPATPPRPRVTANWAEADSVLVFNEINYHPRDEMAGTEWLELRSLQGVDVDISGWRLEGGVSFTFPAGTIVRGREFIVVAANPAHASLAGSGALGPFSGALDNGGEELRLINNSGRIMDRVIYSDEGDWPAGPDGSGATLAKFDEEFADSGPTNWTTSAKMGGTPGAANFLPGARYPGYRLILNEISGTGNPEFRIELLNVSGEPIDLGEFSIVSSSGQIYAPPAQTIAPGEVGTILITPPDRAPSAGNRLYLLGGGGAEFDDAVEIADRLQGRTTSGRWGFPSEPSFGAAANSFVINSDVVINEIMYHPHPDQAAREQWVELYNRGSEPALIGGWQLADGIRFTFPARTNLAPGQYLLISNDPGAFASHLPGATILGPFWVHPGSLC